MNRLRCPCRLAVVALAVWAGAAPGRTRADAERVVRRGETLWQIAREAGVTVAELRAANGIGEDARILAGQRLRIPASPAGTASGREGSRGAEGAESGGDLVRPVAIENADVALAGFFSALDRVVRREPAAVVRIAHFGDSHAASSSSLADAVRATLAARFGDAGPGFLQPGRPWSSYDPPGVEIGATGSWTFDRVRRSAAESPADGNYGLGAYTARSAEAGAVVWLQTKRGATVAGFEVEYLLQPGGGSAELFLDGAVVARLETAAAGVAAARHRVLAEESAHRLEVRVVGDGEVRLLGFDVVRPGPGVRYDVLAANGARADWLLAWNAELLRESLAHRDPDLVLLMYGTNEAEDEHLDLERYRADFAAALALIRSAVPDASCLVLAPPDMSPRRRRRFVGTPEALARIVDLQREAARSAGCAFFDTFAAMGGAGAMDRWAAMDPPLGARDRVHLTARGYRVLGEAITAALLRAYEERPRPAVGVRNSDR